MHTTAQAFFKSAIAFLIVGLCAGIYMAASHDHTIAGAHAHLNLIGFVVSAVYGTFYGLSPAKADGLLPRIVWGLHTLGIAVMFPALALLLMGNVALEPVVAISSMAVFAAALLFAWTVFRKAPEGSMATVSRARATA